MTAERIGLLIHLLGAFAFIGGAMAAGIGFEVARRRHAAIEVAAVLSVARVGALIAGVGGVVLLLGGMWLAGDLDLYRTRWLQASILAFVLSRVCLIASEETAFPKGFFVSHYGPDLKP